MIVVGFFLSMIKLIGGKKSKRGKSITYLKIYPIYRYSGKIELNYRIG